MSGLLASGVYSCEIIARSTAAPAPATALTYTVRIFTDRGVYDRENVRPQSYDRTYWDNVGGAEDDPMHFVPFDLGFRTGVVVISQGGREQLDLIRGEWPAGTDCEEQP